MSTLTGQKLHAFKALECAAYRCHKDARFDRNWKGQIIKCYLSYAHKEIAEKIDELCRDKITPEEAMAFLHEPHILNARTKPN